MTRPADADASRPAAPNTEPGTSPVRPRLAEASSATANTGRPAPKIPNAATAMNENAPATTAQTGAPARSRSARRGVADGVRDPGQRRDHACRGHRQACALDQQHRQQSGHRHELEGVEPEDQRQQQRPLRTQHRADACADVGDAESRGSCRHLRQRQQRHHNGGGERQRAVADPERAPAERQDRGRDQHHRRGSHRQVSRPQRQHGVEVARRGRAAQQRRNGEHGRKKTAAFDDARADQQSPAAGRGSDEAAECRHDEAGHRRAARIEQRGQHARRHAEHRAEQAVGADGGGRDEQRQLELALQQRQRDRRLADLHRRDHAGQHQSGDGAPARGRHGLGLHELFISAATTLPRHRPAHQAAEAHPRGRTPSLPRLCKPYRFNHRQAELSYCNAPFFLAASHHIGHDQTEIHSRKTGIHEQKQQDHLGHEARNPACPQRRADTRSGDCRGAGSHRQPQRTGRDRGRADGAAARRGPRRAGQDSAQRPRSRSSRSPSPAPPPRRASWWSSESPRAASGRPRIAPAGRRPSCVLSR